MGARCQGDEWCQSGNRLLPVEPTGPDTIENRNALAEHRQHRRAAGRVDAGGERAVEIFEPPRVELRLEAVKSREKPRNSGPAPRFQSQKPRGGTLSLHEKHRARRGLAERHLNRDLSGSGGEFLLYRRERVFEQARGAVPAETGGVRVTSASHCVVRRIPRESARASRLRLRRVPVPFRRPPAAASRRTAVEADARRL